ncbi:hypothetical protein [Metabacillus litoralis]|uniref:hypothetical protein n=1 Tax=Metabacillus litoralis TaxID=152268 RepID=UPI001CFE5BEA|nr:hypothetical protein [Metabacillus litoralis]
MELKYNLTEEDYLHFNLFHIKNSKAGQNSLIIQRYSTPIMFIGMSFLFSTILDIPFLVMFFLFL